MNRPRIYLASPLGFAESTRAFVDQLVASLREHVDVENPWDDTRFEDDFAEIASLPNHADRIERLHAINTELGRANTERIDRSDALFAILDGVDVDSGTAAEIGYAYARGKQVSGLRTDFRLAGDNIGAVVNLQVQYFIEHSGGKVATSSAALIQLAHELAAAKPTAG